MTKFIERQKEFRGEFLKRRKNKIILVLDNFRSATHVAQVFKIAYAIGVDRVYLVGTTPKPPFGRELAAMSDGAEGKLDVRESASTKKLIQQHSAKGFATIAMAMTKETQIIENIEIDADVLLVMTDQNQNLSKEIMKECAYLVGTSKFRKYTDAGIINDLAIVLYHLK